VDEARWTWLLTAGKIAGALAAIGALVLGLGGWAFSVAMSERDDKIEDLEREITSLRGATADMSSSMNRMSDNLVDARIALEALNARMQFLTAAPGPTPTVRVRTRPRSTAVITPTSAPISDEDNVPPEALVPVSGLTRPQLRQEQTLHTDREAAEVFNGAMQGLEDL
jgi:hypothetical protein